MQILWAENQHFFVFTTNHCQMLSKTKIAGSQTRTEREREEKNKLTNDVANIKFQFLEGGLIPIHES